MITYNDLYETLRKERYSEQLQPLPAGFLSEVAAFLQEQKQTSSIEDTPFLEGAVKSKKQFENSIGIFKELILRRKKKLLNLVFVATETGIMKRDYEQMLSFEKDAFDAIVKMFENNDKELARLLHGGKAIDKEQQAMIIFTQGVEQFVDMGGKIIGPFNSGELANLDSAVCSILVSSGKANYVDEK